LWVNKRRNGSTNNNYITDLQNKEKCGKI